MAAIVNDKDKILQSATVRLPASLGNAIYFSNPAPVFKVLPGGNAQPASYAIEAKFSGQIRGTVTWSVVTGTVTAAGQAGNTWTINYADLGSDVAIIRATLVYLGTTYTNELAITRVADARSVNLTMTAQAFTYNSAGNVPSPASSVVTATAQNVTTTVFYEFLVNNSTVQNSQQNTYTYTPPASFSQMPQQISVRLREGSASGVIVATDVMSMQATRPGVSPVSVSLSREAHVFAANPNGSVVTYGNSGTTINLLEGFTALQYDGIGTSPGTWRVTAVGTNITVGAITDSGTFATVADHSNFPNTEQLASIAYTITGRSTTGEAFTVQRTQSFTKAVAGEKGVTGDKTTTQFLYQWSTVRPGNPSGTSVFNWASSTHSTYTGGGGWFIAVPTNPGTPLIKLWEAAKTISAPNAETATSINWTTGVTIADVSQNGAAGSQAVKVRVFQWSITIPAAPSGTAVYTWSSGSISAVPASWALTPGNPPSPGMTLYQAEVNVVDSAVNTTTTFNWTTASVGAIGYAGTNGARGPAGDSITGPQGVSARNAYARIANGSVPVSAVAVIAGDTLPNGFGGWGPPFNTTWSTSDPDPNSNNTLYQSDGLFNPSTGLTTWTTPYVSSLKVGALSAITANMGEIRAGLMKSADDKFIINLTDKFISISV
jgi:hypothetical protein